MGKTTPESGPNDAASAENALLEATKGSTQSASQSLFQSECIAETSDTKQFSSSEQDNIARNEALVKLTRALKDQISGLGKLSANNAKQVLKEFQKTFDEALELTQKHTKAYISEGTAIEEALSALALYNQKVLTRMNKLIVDAVKSLDEAQVSGYTDPAKVSEALVEHSKQLVEAAQRQLQYSKEIGAVAKPLSSWRLDAFRVLWDAKCGLKLAEARSPETKEALNQPPVEATSTPPVMASNTSEQREATDN